MPASGSCSHSTNWPPSGVSNTKPTSKAFHATVSTRYIKARLLSRPLSCTSCRWELTPQSEHCRVALTRIGKQVCRDTLRSSITSSVLSSSLCRVTRAWLRHHRNSEAKRGGTLRRNPSPVDIRRHQSRRGHSLDFTQEHTQSITTPIALGSECYRDCPLAIEQNLKSEVSQVISGQWISTQTISSAGRLAHYKYHLATAEIPAALIATCNMAEHQGKGDRDALQQHLNYDKNIHALIRAELFWRVITNTSLIPPDSTLPTYFHFYHIMSVAGIPPEAFSDAIEAQKQVDEDEIQKLLAKQLRRLNELQERYHQPISSQHILIVTAQPSSQTTQAPVSRGRHIYRFTMLAIALAFFNADLAFLL